MKCLACIKVQALPLYSGAGLVRQLHARDQLLRRICHLAENDGRLNVIKRIMLLAVVPVAVSIYFL